MGKAEGYNKGISKRVQAIAEARGVTVQTVWRWKRKCGRSIAMLEHKLENGWDPSGPGENPGPSGGVWGRLAQLLRIPQWLFRRIRKNPAWPLYGKPEAEVVAGVRRYMELFDQGRISEERWRAFLALGSLGQGKRRSLFGTKLPPKPPGVDGDVGP